tara:strand:- start:47963 stop:48232 length:270 start_codon:yes stop_codon:yes gene_type:complete
MIPVHQRRNYEKTDDLLNDLNCILVALDALSDVIPSQEATPETNAVAAMLRMAREKVEEIENARSFEWVGLGGASDKLTDAEIAEASGA